MILKSRFRVLKGNWKVGGLYDKIVDLPPVVHFEPQFCYSRQFLRCCDQFCAVLWCLISENLVLLPFAVLWRITFFVVRSIRARGSWCLFVLLKLLFSQNTFWTDFQTQNSVSREAAQIQVRTRAHLTVRKVYTNAREKVVPIKFLCKAVLRTEFYLSK